MDSNLLQCHRQLNVWHQVLIRTYLEEGRRADAHAQALRAFAAIRANSFFASYCQSGGETSEVALGQFVAIAESWGLREVLLLLEEVEAWPQLAQRLDQCTDADLQE
ncbi:hypothetical protein LZT27_22080 [Aeromonas veronii]|uniref:hypothetical protein n=1 Tax=Aeromonas veronii TaxID=654 RepID=UPI0023641CA7|nr:hypothetical protein [Aeromonas veronii]MDD1847255.1 hypothetical protein [Aeromonas veronii]